MSELLDWLFAQQRFGVKFGLGRVRALLKRLDHPQEQFECILVGGTNGKGSTAATLASILRESGKRAGLFTSPHLSYFSERFVVNGKALDEQLVLAALERVKPHAVALEATFFEIVVVLSCVLFAEQKVEVAVMEVGMGGLNDATNALEPVLSLITNVALDHTQVLGDTVEAIALKKSGIMRPHKLCLSAATMGAASVLKGQADKFALPLWLVGEAIAVEILEHSWQGLSLNVSSPEGSSTVQSTLLGAFQADNVALAVAAAHHFRVSEEAIQTGVNATRWPGRLELIHYKERRFLLDGAHNPAAAQALRQTLIDLNAQPKSLIFGVNQDKNVADLLEPLASLVSQVVFTQAQLSPKAAFANELSAFSPNAEAFEKPQEAIDYALSHSYPNDLILIAGSLYLIGEVRPILLNKDAEQFERWQ